MKHKALFISVASIVVFANCANENYVWKNPSTIEESVLMIPDSVATNSQKK